MTNSIETAPKCGRIIYLWHSMHECWIAAAWQSSEFAGYKDMWFEATMTTCWPDAAFSHWIEPIEAPQ